MTVSIIIAVKTWQNNLAECVVNCLGLDYPNFEIIILPDARLDESKIQGLSPKGAVPVCIIPTGPITPPKKRDLGINQAKGDIIAFIDDDAYPRKDWLRNAVKNFFEPEVAAVGGPAITPPCDNLLQKASGEVFASFLVSGNFSYRYIPAKKREVDDYPSCNFLVRRSVLQELGGFNTNFWPGEDTKLCLDIVHKLKKEIIYDPQVLVWHHRRQLFIPHLRQVASYALHRGYFAKKYPQTSFKLSYFVPSLFLFFVISGFCLSFVSMTFFIFYSFALLIYLLLVSVSGILKGLRMFPFVFLGIIGTHFVYGLYFLKGLFSPGLKEDKAEE